MYRTPMTTIIISLLFVGVGILVPFGEQVGLFGGTGIPITYPILIESMRARFIFDDTLIIRSSPLTQLVE